LYQEGKIKKPMDWDLNLTEIGKSICREQNKFKDWAE
jgi:hypothetical protein